MSRAVASAAPGGAIEFCRGVAVGRALAGMRWRSRCGRYAVETFRTRGLAQRWYALVWIDDLDVPPFWGRISWHYSRAAAEAACRQHARDMTRVWPERLAEARR